MNLQRFESLGFDFPNRVISEERAQSYRQRLDDSKRAVGGRFTGLMTQKPHLLFTWLAELARESAVLDLAQNVVGPNILLWSTEFFIKDPGEARYVPWHVDDTFWHIEPEVQATVWIALSDIRIENGPLRYIPGSHRQPKKAIKIEATPENMLNSGQVAQGVDEEQAVDVLLRPGEAAIHDGRTLHASGRNTGADSRVGVVARFLSTSVRSTKDRESASLVRGVDDYGYWDLEPAPKSDLDEDARAVHARAADMRMRNMHGADHDALPALKAGMSA